MFSNFDFLKKDFPVLYNFGIQAERYCYNDSNSCLMKLGMIGETIVNLMFTYDRIAPPDDNTAVKRIDTLYREGLLTQDLVDILHALYNNHKYIGSITNFVGFPIPLVALSAHIE